MNQTLEDFSNPIGSSDNHYYHLVLVWQVQRNYIIKCFSLPCTETTIMSISIYGKYLALTVASINAL